MASTIVADRLYALHIRAQELALFGGAARTTLRYAPMCDDPDTAQSEHFTVLVLEIDAQVPRDAASELELDSIQVLKVGWELELRCEPPCTPAQREESPNEVRFLLERMATAVNRLASDAGIDAPLSDALIDRLVMDDRLERLNNRPAS